ncbi:hypothetical protein DPMN_135222 [Dreissena polymorpha]|uniref:Uncharacterized protein n=1 Tax=Dreissena polymorpha TaxID=45954 RepID=A0A9D4G0J1_DREPO|nr:hypothetical protein DPMN_135222 [Dreissena polymorpha]
MAYACVYFPEDVTLSVVNEKDPDLTIITTFELREKVEMLWKSVGKSKKAFEGVIVKVAGDEESLSMFASKAHKSLLVDLEPGSPPPDELFNFSIKGKGKAQKRASIPTKRLEESKAQDASFSPKKVKKSIQEKKTPKPAKQDKKSVSSETALETGKILLNLTKQFSFGIRRNLATSNNANGYMAYMSWCSSVLRS